MLIEGRRLIRRIVPFTFSLLLCICISSATSYAENKTEITGNGYESKINKIIRFGYLRDYEHKQNAFSVNFIMNRFIKSNALAGIGIGMEKFGSDYLIPIYIDYRNYPESPDRHIYLWGNVGYAMGMVENLDGMFHGGLLVGIGFGAQFVSSYSTYYSFEIGLKHQMQDVAIINSYYYDPNSNELILEIKKGRMERKIIAFNFVAWLDL